MNQERKLPVARPATDILEREDGFHIFLDMPGVKREDLAIDLRENEVVVSAPAEYEYEKEGASLIAVEFGSGEYRRSFTLSEVVDRQNIQATLKNGVLELFLPRREEEKPKRIEIQAG
ncbi:Hsp20/alpha crystallin family protein [Desulfohalovibrio reitneri]|uniref:Hsp20/alpha crystallin family protein n=1 Tax=Desulfohalovibrio reitneri TaxID=1307759 RepID=UPI0004A72A19|nr:Hsp20/alpha crystallin family protein [Desulfohalovibrio reitneri]